MIHKGDKVNLYDTFVKPTSTEDAAVSERNVQKLNILLFCQTCHTNSPGNSGYLGSFCLWRNKFMKKISKLDKFCYFFK